MAERAIRNQLTIPQHRFLALPNKFRAYVAGFGAGKTWVGCTAMCDHFYQWPKINQGYFAPTYPQIRDIFYPTIEEVAELNGLRVDIKEANREVHFYSGRRYRGTTICRSMDKPESIVGFKIGNALVDEIDVMKREKAERAWRKVIARMRFKVDGLKNGIDVTTTPEGFRFVYEQFKKKPREKAALAKLYGMVQASTYDNEKNLPDDYISSLFETYPENLIDAYLKGLFVNLTSGTVYYAFDRKKSHTDVTMKDGEPIHIGMDFNVGKMAAIVHVIRNGVYYAVDEIINAYDTPDMIKKIRERYWRYEGGKYHSSREISVYPDSTGGSRKSVNASVTDIAELRAAGFKVFAPEANPPVKDRVNAMNRAFQNAKGERLYFVNTHNCPRYTETLEQQVWENGEPEKSNDLDHPNDAAGYFIVWHLPIVKPAIQTTLKMGA